MRPRIARLLRRRGNRPIPGMNQARRTGIDLANRTIRFAGQEAGKATAGLFETFIPTSNAAWAARITAGLAGATPALPNAARWQKRGIFTRLADWLDHNDYGYPIGLLLYLIGAVALFFQAWWTAAPLIVTAFILCWWFG